MKLVILLITLIAATSAFCQKKYALIVAVGEYPKNSRVPPIASVNDVPYLKTALKKHGFIEKNIDTLINAKATKTAILNSLTNLATKAKPNDIVVIHFAAHGQQIRDQRTIELGKDEDDGYDESILPYDAQGSYRATGYKGENHLRDDDLAPKLMAIRKAIGKNGSLLIMIDACHSGTGTRSESFSTSRGEPIPFPDPENPLEATINISEAEKADSFFELNADSLGNMVVISGSGPHQENKQMIVNYEELGSLSYSFYKAINEMQPHSTYRDLYEKIKATIQAAIPDQLPMIEGNPDQVIFSGTYKPKDEKIYVRVGVKNFSDGKEDSLFTVERGLMDNVTEGTVCKIYKGNEFISEAIIRKAENFKSFGIADKKLNKSELYEIRFEEQSLGNFLAGLKIDNNINDQQSILVGKQVAALVQPYKFITITDKADYLFEIKNHIALLKDRNDRIVWSKELATGDTLLDTDKKQIISDIKRAMRVKYLRTMPDGGSLSGMVKVTIIPESDPDATGEPVMIAGERYSLKIENHSDRKLFYTVIDILPDNSVEVLYPFKDKEPANYSVEKGKEVIRKLGLPADALTGREVLKVIVSREPMDLRSVFARKKERSDNNSFQRTIDDIFKDGDDEKATRSDVSSISVEEVGIVTVGFTVKKQ